MEGALTHTFLSSRAELPGVSLNKSFSFGNCELPSKRRELYITFTPISLKIILCFTPHSPQNKCFCLPALCIKKSSYGCYKSIPCSITWPLKPWWWVLVRFSGLAFVITKIEVNFRNTSSSRLTMSFVFKFSTLYDFAKKKKVSKFIRKRPMIVTSTR